jgi:hypothetical protein
MTFRELLVNMRKSPDSWGAFRSGLAYPALSDRQAWTLDQIQLA